MPSNVETTWLAYSDLDMSRIMPFATPQFMQDYASIRQRQIITQNELVNADDRLNGLDQDVLVINGRLDSIDAEIVIINQRIDAVEAAAFMAIIT